MAPRMNAESFEHPARPGLNPPRREDSWYDDHPERQLCISIYPAHLAERNTLMRKATSIFLFLLALSSGMAAAQNEEAVAEMARKAQDPLGNVRAIMTDNTIAFDGGPDDDTSYAFQIQPVYAIQNDTSWNMIARGIVPVMGFEPGVVTSRIGAEPRPEDGDEWGIGDSVMQFFFSPKSDAAWKWGAGPQVSLKTHSSSRQKGAGWGGGLAGVIFGGAGDWALGAIAMQHWGEDDFNVGTLQLIATYNFPNAPGMYLGYNNSLSFNWEADSGEEASVPLGLTLGRTFLVGNGNGLDLSIGAYEMIEKPEDAPEWQLKFGISYFFN